MGSLSSSSGEPLDKLHAHLRVWHGFFPHMGCCNKLPQSWWHKQQMFISHSSGGQECNIKVLAKPRSALSWSLCIRALISLIGAPSVWPSQLPKAPPSLPTNWVSGFWCSNQGTQPSHLYSLTTTWSSVFPSHHYLSIEIVRSLSGIL